jgi:hypothetical protein
MAAAGALLAARTPRLLRFVSAAAGAGKRKLTVTTGGVASIDVWVNGRPVATSATAAGTTQVTVPAADGAVIRVEGYDAAGVLVAASQQTA